MYFCILRCVLSVPLLRKVLELVENNITVCFVRCVTSVLLLRKALEHVEHKVLVYSEMCDKYPAVMEVFGESNA